MSLSIPPQTDTEMPDSIFSIDTTAVVSDGIALAPQTANDTISILPGDTLSAVISTQNDTISPPSHSVIEMHDGLTGTPRYTNAPLFDGGLFMLLLGELIIFLLFIRYRKRIFSWQKDDDASLRRDKNRTRHLIGINAHIRNLFLAYSFLVIGTLGSISLFVGSIEPPIPGGYATNALLLTLPAALYFLLQQGIITLLVAVFSPDTRGREWCDDHLVINLLLGIVLFPAVFLATYLPEIEQTCIIVGTALYFISRIIFIIKGVKLFLQDFRCLLYFILYLCGLELAPLFLIGKISGFL